MNLNSFENHLFEEGGVKYTRDAEHAEGIGYTEVTYNQTFFDQKKNDVVTMQSSIHVRNRDEAIKLCNYWNGRATNYKYWI